MAGSKEEEMTQDDIIRMAREAHLDVYGLGKSYEAFASALERFFHAAYAAGAVAERNSAAAISVDFARKWWSLHCATNKHMEITLMAHNDFCALQSAIRARGEK